MVSIGSENSTPALGSTSAPTSTSESTPTFAQLPRKLIKAIQKLEALSIDSTLPSLPKIVVVGDQSHGKSSIIEAVCDITLPRSEGTCTRCPFLITTTASKTSENWVCKISLHLRYEYLTTSKQPRWEDTGAQNAVEFAVVTDKSLLDHALRLAQLAILNPQMKSSDILMANNLEIGNKISFSPNIISLEVAAHDMPELSLFDLPGAINIAEKSDEQHLVGFIEKLVKRYVKDEKALILLAVAANCDTDTSTAFKFVDQCKARDRCVGVLTKPDLIIKKSQQLRRVLNGEIFQVGNGWFVTKQLSQEELDEGVMHTEAGEREHAFFSRAPWNTTLGEFEARFGIPNLQGALSQKLTDHILDYLPEINARVDARLQQVASQLAGFPEQARAPCLTVMNEADSVTSVIITELHGSGNDDENFRYAYRRIIQSLRQQLRSARPELVLATPGVKQRIVPIPLDSSDDEHASPPTPSKIRKGNDGRGLTTHRVVVKTEESVPTQPVKTVFRLDQIKQAYDRGWTSGLSVENNPKVTERLVLQALSGWPQMVDSTLENVQQLTANMISTCISEVLSSRRQTKLFTEASHVVSSLFLELMCKQRDLLHNVVACEMHKPITYAHTALKADTEANKQDLISDRTNQRLNEYFDALDSRIKQPAKQEERKKQANLGPDPYVREVEAVAKIHAYYDIASRGMVDAVAKHLEYGLMHALEMSLKDRLREGKLSAVMRGIIRGQANVLSRPSSDELGALCATAG